MSSIGPSWADDAWDVSSWHPDAWGAVSDNNTIRSRTRLGGLVRMRGRPLVNLGAIVLFASVFFTQIEQIDTLFRS